MSKFASVSFGVGMVVLASSLVAGAAAQAPTANARFFLRRDGLEKPRWYNLRSGARRARAHRQ